MNIHAKKGLIWLIYSQVQCIVNKFTVQTDKDKMFN